MKLVGLALALLGLVGCEGCDEPAPAPVDTTTSPSTDSEPATSSQVSTSAEPEVMVQPRCPPDMVRVWALDHVDGGVEPGRAFCVDRYEAMLVDADGDSRISPYYAPSRRAARGAAKAWESQRFEMGGPQAQAEPLPPLPAWELSRDFEPRAVVRKAVTPNGHVSGAQAKVACERAGKRLCSWPEWRLACGGEQGRAFPYGDSYVHGRCNVFREAHPAAVLHDNASIGHTDPRLNRVQVKGRPLLRKTGATPECASRWADDAIYDMVGNLDEWLDDPEGAFAGGFYARSSKKGCDWMSTAHSFVYADYSTGVRCCADLPVVGSAPAPPVPPDSPAPLPSSSGR